MVPEWTRVSVEALPHLLIGACLHSPTSFIQQMPGFSQQSVLHKQADRLLKSRSGQPWFKTLQVSSLTWNRIQVLPRPTWTPTALVAFLSSLLPTLLPTCFQSRRPPHSPECATCLGALTLCPFCLGHSFCQVTQGTSLGLCLHIACQPPQGS